jgi:4-hydroxybenzoate polyprenyltransferase
MSQGLPLCVDLDGTLIRSDMLHELSLRLLGERPWNVLSVPIWLMYGKAVLKQKLADRCDFDPSALPYNDELIIWLRQQRAEGRRLVLCTASDQGVATAIASHLGLFDEVLASDGVVNLAGLNKAEVLVARFGDKGFDYAGNSAADLPVWAHARRAIVVNASAGVQREAEACAAVEKMFAGPARGFGAWRRVLRLHQWLKNLLLFVPFFAAHRIGELGLWLMLGLAFIAFSLCASSVYIANDLLDLESDRKHPRKRMRPFAAGMVPVWQGALVAPLLLIAGFSLATQVGGHFVYWLASYFLLTCLYSFKLKQFVLIDCLILAVLYTLRIVAGAAAVAMGLSFWLLAFSGFLFLSLAFVKRFAELQVQLLNGKHQAYGRGYFTDDAPLVQMLGIVSGYSAVVVLALYLNSPDVQRLYLAPEWIWGCVPVMLFWVSSVWLQAHRGQMHDDPMVFAVKDKSSLIAGAFFVLFLLLGAMGVAS